MTIARILHFPIISVSTALKNQLVRVFHVSPRQIMVVKNGVDIDRYLPLSDEEKSRIQEKLQIREGDYVVSEVARLTYGKGQELAARSGFDIM